MKYLTLLVALLFLVGCAPRASMGIGGRYEHFETNQGLECVSWKEGNGGGGLSCNWEKFNREHP